MNGLKLFISQARRERQAFTTIVLHFLRAAENDCKYVREDFVYYPPTFGGLIHEGWTFYGVKIP